MFLTNRNLPSNFFSSALEDCPFPAWMRCINGKYLWINKEFLQFFNVQLEQIVNNLKDDFTYQALRDECQKNEQKVIEKKQSNTIVYDEERYKVKIYQTPIFNEQNEVVAVSTLIIDFVETEVETKLNNVNELYQSILNSMVYPVLFINNKLEIEIINKAQQEQLLSVGIQNVRNCQELFEAIKKPWQKGGNEFSLKNSIILKVLEGEVVLNEERSYINQLGELKTFRIVGIPIKNKKGDVVRGALITASEITQEKKLFEILKQKNELIRQQNEELHHFAYSAAHDLRDPLRNISLAADVMEKSLQEENYDEVLNLLKRQLKTASYGSLLVKNLLDYSASNQPIKLEEVYLRDIIAHNVNILSELLEQDNTTIFYDNLPFVLGNTQQLQILFQNLISNSIRHKGLNPPRIIISAVKVDSFWEVCFQDNGPGIEDQYKEIVFHPFKRLKANSNSRSSGLGLSICRRIIEQHGGRIWLDKKQGTGACFKFTLPMIASRKSLLYAV